jgi:hypothetical protein
LPDSGLQSDNYGKIEKRFTLRALFVVLAGICAIMGYWIALPHVLPPWHRLLNQIDFAYRSVEDDGILYGKLSAFPDWQGPTHADVAVGMSVLIGFYLVKIVISRRVYHWAVQIVAYVMLLSLVLPYIYIRWEDWSNPHIFLVGNWCGSAVAVLAIPTFTFMFDLIDHRVHSNRWMIVRSSLEILVGIPVWTIFWAFFSFFILGFGWV